MTSRTSITTPRFRTRRTIEPAFGRTPRQSASGVGRDFGPSAGRWISSICGRFRIDSAGGGLGSQRAGRHGSDAAGGPRKGPGCLHRGDFSGTQRRYHSGSAKRGAGDGPRKRPFRTSHRLLRQVRPPSGPMRDVRGQIPDPTEGLRSTCTQSESRSFSPSACSSPAVAVGLRRFPVSATLKYGTRW